ncbi:hypothetical protein PG988_007961 [Apiospora saccharicola]
MATLGFDSVDTLAAWPDSNGVKPLKEEFIRDHLSPDPTATAAAATAANDADYAKVTSLLGVNWLMNFAVLTHRSKQLASNIGILI